MKFHRLAYPLRDSFSASTGSYVHRQLLYSQTDSQAQAPRVHQRKTGGLSHCLGATSFGISTVTMQYAVQNGGEKKALVIITLRQKA